jgi:hypothetical protein
MYERYLRGIPQIIGPADVVVASLANPSCWSSPSWRSLGSMILRCIAGGRFMAYMVKETLLRWCTAAVYFKTVDHSIS